MATSNSVRPTGTPAPLCVGRESELEQLALLHAEAPEHGERLVLVEGPPGSGKTRLLHELARRARLDGGVVLEGRCDPGRAFGPFATIVDRALRFLSDMSMEPSIELRDLGCGDGCHRFWHQHALDAHAAAGVTRDARERRLRFFDAVRGLLRDVARVRPPLVLLHDLERADAATLQLLRYVFDGAGPWNDGVGVERVLRALFVASVAEGDAREDIDALRQSASTTRLCLSALDAAGVRAYLQSDDAVRRVLERTGGVPERIELLLQAEPLAADEAIAQTLGAMPAGARALTEALSVLAQPTDLDALRGLVEVPVSPAERQVFADHELIQRTVLDGRLLFTFARETLRTLAYLRIEPERRRALHQRCAHYLATHASGDQAAHHALAAGDLEMAVPLALADARALAARHAHSEGAALLERVLAEGPGAEPSVALHDALAELYRVVGDYGRGLKHAERVREARPGDAEAAHQVGRLLTLAGRLDEAASRLRDAHRIAESDETRVAVEAAVAELEYQRGAYDEAARWAETALQSRPGAALEVQARNTLGKVALARKEAASAADLFAANQARAHEAGLGNLEAQALTNLGVARLRQHRLGDAERCFTRSLAIAADVNDSRERAIATENLAVLAHLRRDFAVALDHYERGVALLKRLGNRTMLARIGINMGELYHSIGDFARARSLAEFAQHMGGASLPDYFLAEIVLLRGRIELSEGRLALARGYLESSLETYDKLGTVKGILPRLALIRVALEEGALERARELLEGAPTLDTPPAAAELALLEAELARAEGREVLELAERAERVIRDTGDPELHLDGLVVLARAQADAGQLIAAQSSLVEVRQIEASLEAKVPEISLAQWSTRPMRRRLEAAEDVVARARFGRARSSSVPPPMRRRSAEHDRRYPDIVGSSARTTQLLEVLDKVAPSDTTVLIRGESGTGKELVAEAMHGGSPRRDRPLVKVNCAALVETLLMSELFGHERGAFTGATSRKKGRFELADGGTLFLDEIGDISPKMQVALLRVLQEREFERVGGTAPIKVDTRIIAATHRNLEEMVAQGTFREDLYYRLRGVTVEVAPLRDRSEDLPELVGRLLARIGEERGEGAKHASPEVLAMLARHRWPGNVRELQNVLRSATLFAEGDILRLSDFSTFAELPQNASPTLTNERADVSSLEEAIYARVREGDASLFELKKVIERECISRALTETSGNITKAADLLGMKRPRLSQLVKQYGLGDSTRVG